MKNKKSLGQHWLKNRALLDEIAALTKVGGVDTCIEIGPGLGTLTSSLLRQFNEVIAIEYDHDLAQKLPASFPGKNLRVVEGDVLTTDFASLLKPMRTSDQADSQPTSSSGSLESAETRPYCIAGNIPYYITSPIVRKTLSLNPRPARIVLLMQKEVAERIAAEPGDYSLLSLMAQNLAEAELGPVVKAEEFTPPPKVDSRVLVLTPLAEPQVNADCLELAKRGFLSPRKKLASVLADSRISKTTWRNCLEQNAINPDARAEDLNLWDWENLYNSVSDK